MDSKQGALAGVWQKIGRMLSEHQHEEVPAEEPAKAPPKEDLSEEDVKANETIEKMISQMGDIDFNKYIPKQTFPDPYARTYNYPEVNPQRIEELRGNVLELINSTCAACRCHIGTAILPPEVRLDHKYGDEKSTFTLICPTCGYRMVFEVEGL